MVSPPIRVLMLCMGNICRSPTAEGVLRARLREAPDLSVVVDSAGTLGYHVGDAPDARAIHHARSRGIDLSALRARQLRPDDFEIFDWILCMDDANRTAALRQCSGHGEDRLHLLLDFAQMGEREVPDPYYGGPQDFERALDLIELGVAGFIRELRRVTGRSSPIRT